MTSSSRMVGPVRVRPQIKNGAETGNWFVDVPASLTSNGRRKRKLFDSEKKAVTAAKALQQRIDPITGLVVVKPGKSGIKIEEAIALWAKHEEQRVLTLKKRPKTLKTDLYKLKAVVKFFGGRALASITEKDLVAFQAARLEDGVKPITVNGELNILNLVFNWAVKQRHLLTAPKCERVPQAPAKTIVPSPEEVVRIITHLPDYLKPLIRFLAETGCRKGEAINLTWECVDDEAGFVEIESREGWTPKTQQSDRRIPLSDGLLEVIRNLPRKGAYVFPGDHPDKPIGEFRKTWNKAVAEAKIFRRGRSVHVTVKSLRKAHATWQAERGVAESVLQGLMGHAKGSRITRQFYVQVTDEAKRAAVIELPGQAAPVPAITAGDHLNSRKEIKA